MPTDFGSGPGLLPGASSGVGEGGGDQEAAYGDQTDDEVGVLEPSGIIVSAIIARIAPAAAAVTAAITAGEKPPTTVHEERGEGARRGDGTPRPVDPRSPDSPLRRRADSRR
ncbi:hypothetical protein GTY87_39840 [Streptomyces sp. SID7813]|uniref:Uncharacterized protein n=1 Tax=Streptomyces coelicolor (strain ATCC BAA-471 / A3(2) / M145) TaxID=100226 RepID=Q9FBX9_STRCO|nr:hypothetical protein [Streptomyces sp. SID7813]QFI47502.1 hypothetical protein FQ762_40235 [Streptomyces coelicolor A3(2)]CAC03623.1 hypothetical protein SC8E7.02 [Streptomyces coelicolor A3(2)]